MLEQIKTKNCHGCGVGDSIAALSCKKCKKDFHFSCINGTFEGIYIYLFTIIIFKKVALYDFTSCFIQKWR